MFDSSRERAQEASRSTLTAVPNYDPELVTERPTSVAARRDDWRRPKSARPNDPSRAEGFTHRFDGQMWCEALDQMRMAEGWPGDAESMIINGNKKDGHMVKEGW